MSIDRADVEGMVERVNSLAIPAHFGGGFMAEFDAWVFADTGAEIRNFLRVVDDRLFLTRAQRASTEESLEFSSPLLEDMEKFLTYLLCSSLRGDKGLPMLLVVSIPVTIDKVAPGFEVTDSGDRWYELHHSSDGVVRTGNRTELVEFSHYVNLSPEEIRQSALDPEGKPHFMVAAWS